uniref:Putative replication protein n=1 Tax=viral metagenome TaxID=1070528 RepID=A0A6M3L252_9ZZZZ
MEYKLFWVYILDKCDHAGIYKHSNILEKCCLSQSVTWEKALEFLGDRVEFVSGNKYFIPNFIDFQYGKLSEDCRPHKMVISKLKKEKLFQRVSKGYPKGIQRDKDQDKEQEQDKDKDKEQEQNKDTNNQNKDLLINIPNIHKDIVSDLNFVVGTNFKHTSKKTREHINARLKEGYTLEDFKIVHRKKANEWQYDNKFVKYLRPNTLYGTNFESYLNQKEVRTLTKAQQATAESYRRWKEKVENEPENI